MQPSAERRGMPERSAERNDIGVAMNKHPIEIALERLEHFVLSLRIALSPAQDVPHRA